MLYKVHIVTIVTIDRFIDRADTFWPKDNKPRTGQRASWKWNQRRTRTRWHKRNRGNWSAIKDNYSTESGKWCMCIYIYMYLTYIYIYIYIICTYIYNLNYIYVILINSMYVCANNRMSREQECLNTPGLELWMLETMPPAKKDKHNE